MGFILDAILKKDLIGSREYTGVTNYETINSSGNTESFDISGSEQGGLVSMTYSNGASVNMEFTVQGSLDNISFADIPDTPTTITDNSGSITWDFTNLNANHIRISWTVTSGSLDIYGQASYKRRH